MNNEVTGQPQAKQKSLRELLVAGSIRCNLMGKICELNLSIDEVGVPRSIALNLTYTESVTKFNLI